MRNIDDFFKEEDEDTGNNNENGSFLEAFTSMLRRIQFSVLTSDTIKQIVYERIAEVSNNAFAEYIESYTPIQDYKELPPVNLEKETKAIENAYFTKEEIQEHLKHFEEIIISNIETLNTLQDRFMEHKNPEEYPSYVVTLDTFLTMVRILTILKQLL